MHLPYDPATGRLIPEIWERWLEWTRCGWCRHADELRSLKAIYSTPARGTSSSSTSERRRSRGQLEDRRRQGRLLELFDAGHMSISYRYPRSLAFLAEALAPAA